jgi:hypothetical protein
MTRTIFPETKELINPPKNKLSEILKPKNGRPTKFKKSFYKTAYIAFSMGCTEEQFIDFIGISKNCFETWKRKYRSFKYTIEKGKLKHDNSEVVNRLLQRALGYEYEETVEEENPRGTAKRVIKKQKAPDVDAIKCWLSNRHRDTWKFLGYGPKEIDIKSESKITETKEIKLTSDIQREELANMLSILIESGAIKPEADAKGVAPQIH